MGWWKLKICPIFRVLWNSFTDKESFKMLKWSSHKYFDTNICLLIYWHSEIVALSRITVLIWQSDLFFAYFQQSVIQLSDLLLILLLSASHVTYSNGTVSCCQLLFENVRTIIKKERPVCLICKNCKLGQFLISETTTSNCYKIK